MIETVSGPKPICAEHLLAAERRRRYTIHMNPDNAENVEVSGAWPFVWRVRTRMSERFGQGCRVTARGALNSARVEFPDGRWFITSRWYVGRQRI